MGGFSRSVRACVRVFSLGASIWAAAAGELKGLTAYFRHPKRNKNALKIQVASLLKKETMKSSAKVIVDGSYSHTHAAARARTYTCIPSMF